MGADEQIEGHILLLLANQVAIGQGLKELVNGTSAVFSATLAFRLRLLDLSLLLFGLFAAALDNLKELFEFDLLRAVGVNQLHELLHLRAVFY